MNTNSAQQAEQVSQERIATYGDPLFSMQRIGEHWTSILKTFWQNKLPSGAIENLPPIPAHIAATMLMALKIHRMSTPFARKDNDDYVDLRNYATYSEQSNPHIPRQAAEMPSFCTAEDARIRPEHAEETPTPKKERPTIGGIPVYGNFEEAIADLFGCSSVVAFARRVSMPKEMVGSSPEEATANAEPGTPEGREAMGTMMARSVMDLAVAIAKQNLPGFNIEYRITEGKP